MSYNLKPDTSVICQCGCTISKYYMSKHLKTKKHQLTLQDRDHIEVVDHGRYKPKKMT